MKRKEILLTFAAFVAITIFFFYKTFLFGLVPFPGDLLISEYNPWKTYSYDGFNPGSFPNKAQYFDTIRQIYPWQIFATDQLKQGVLPLWNPHNFSGAPLLANIQSAVFYPLHSLYLLLPATFAWAVLIILQPFLSGFFTYLFARTIGIGKIGSFISAVAFSYSLFMTVFLEYSTLGHVILFLPLSLYLLEKLIERITILRAVIFSASIACSFLAGHLQIAGFSLLFVLFYLLFRTRKLRTFAPLVLLSFLGVGVSAVQLFPTFELINLSARVSQDYQFLIEKLLLQPQQLILLFSPDFFGNPATRNYLISDTYPGNALYVGLIPLIFALFSLAHFKKNNFVRFFTVFSALLLFLLLRSPITELIYRLEIPLFSTGAPNNAIFLLAFGLSILSGFGLDFWFKNKRNYRVISFVLGLFIFVWGIVLLARPESVSVRNFFYSTGILGVFLVLFFISEKLLKRKILIAYLFLLITVFDLFYFFHKFNPFVPAQLVFPQARVFEWISNGGINRFWGYGTAAVEANFATQYRLYSPDGYDPLYPRQYGEFLQSSKGGKIVTEFTNQTRSDAVVVRGFGEIDLPANRHRLRVLDVLGTKYILDRVENASSEKTFPSDRFKLVYEEDGWRIFENLKAAPRAFLTSNYKVFRNREEFGRLFFSELFDSSKTILLEHELDVGLNDSNDLSTIELVFYKPNEAIFSVDTDGDKLLFLSDTYYPGWKAFVDGKETKIYRANFAFRSVFVPKGKHTIEFRYAPQSFSLGVKTTIISAVLVVCLAYYLGRKKHAV